MSPGWIWQEGESSRPWKGLARSSGGSSSQATAPEGHLRGPRRSPQGAHPLLALVPVDVTLRQTDLLIHSVPQMWLEGLEILPDGRKEAAVDSVDHLERQNWA